MTADTPDMLTTADVAELRGLKPSSVREYMRRYPATASNPFPVPDRTEGGYAWAADRAGEIKAWAPGKGGLGMSHRRPKAQVSRASSGSFTGELKDTWREVIETLIELRDERVGDSAHVIGGTWLGLPIGTNGQRLTHDPLSGHRNLRTVFPHATLRAMARHGLLELGTGQQNYLGHSSKSYLVATLTPAGERAYRGTTTETAAVDLDALDEQQ